MNRVAGCRLQVAGILLLLLGLASAVTYNNPTSNWQASVPTSGNIYSASDMATFWPITSALEDGTCSSTDDFIIGILPGGCSPSVVTSDLLAEQNVPVFCQLYAIKTNPLIDVSSINSISFKGKYPDEVRSVIFHPARAAVNSYSSLIGDPVATNIGYVVIVLKKEPVEANQSKYVAGNLTATVKYDSESAYGVSAGDYYLEPSSAEDWNGEYMDSSFWNGRGYLRVTDISDGKASIQVMEGRDKIFKTFTLKAGETSDVSYLPGFYCKAGFKIKLNDITTQEAMARLNVDGEDIWVRKGSKFLNDKCSVRSLVVRDNNDGEISISCTGTKGVKTLSIGSTGVELKSGDGYKEFKVGDKYKVDNKEKVVSYIGTYVKGTDSKDFVVLSDVRFSSSEYDKVTGFLKTSKDVGVFQEDVQRIKSGVVVYTEDDKGIFGGFSGINIDNEKESKYFDESVDVVEDLVEDYGNIERIYGKTWAEESLLAEIELAGTLGKFKDQKVLMDLFLDKYPLAVNADYVRNMRSRMEGSDFSNSYVNLYVVNTFRSISVVDFKPMDEGEKTVSLKIGRETKSWTEGSKVPVEDKGTLEILSIVPGKVRFSYDSNEKNSKDKRNVYINEGEIDFFDEVSVGVVDVKVNEVAHVRLIPEFNDDKTEGNFSFKIGIEQRLIELSPNKAKRMMEELNDTIAEWQELVDDLAKLVKAWRGACLATSLVLQIKNAGSSSGAGIARNMVMEKYRSLCDREHPEMSRTQCYNEYSSEIDNEVASATKILESVNSKMKSVQGGNTVSGGLFGADGIADQDKYLEDLRGLVGSKIIGVKVDDGESVEVSVDKLTSTSQVRAVLAWEEAKGTDLEETFKGDLDDELRNLALRVQQDNDADAEKEKCKAEANMGDCSKTVSLTSKNTQLVKWTEEYAKGINGLEKVKDTDRIQKVDASGNTYLIVLGTKTNKGYSIGKLFLRSGSNWVLQDLSDANKRKEIPEVVQNTIVVVEGAGTGDDCSNAWPAGKATVSYYETGDVKGFPAVVPFDLTDGWYAKVSASTGSIGTTTLQGYTDSGEVKNFYICNIGSNQVMELSGDSCQGFHVNTAESIDSIGGCSNADTKKEVENLYNKALEAIRKAQQQYGKKNIDIFGQIMSTGEPVSSLDGVECQDFMSPDDCKLLFNVCDPVICPPSRCDLGGKYPVSDVIQSGIVGSIALCLPNAKEGIMVPVCVSGIQAGLDAYLSILKSEMECLNKSIETGELVGICDQITAVYKCEFFWRQLGPFMDKLLPAVLDFGSTRNLRGGGEYALTEQAWESAKASMSYMRDSYAANAFKAFNLRSTEEAGSLFCKAFMGGNSANLTSLLDNLLEPESPYQFYAQFTEKLFTEATVPSTSQYKVYFHIYAGKDEAVQYRVYLKNPPAGSYYNSNPTVTVKTGFIAKGDSADESIDFTAPSGYKELCADINGKENCDFKSVTTDFGINYLKDKYVEDQATTTDITTEKDCVSGTSSGMSLLNLNLQAGIQETISPDITLSGIVRICATKNPETGVSTGNYVSCSEDDATSKCSNGYSCTASYCKDKDGNYERSNGRWRDVGYCGDSALRCWLDVSSVEDSLKKVAAIEGKSITTLDRATLIENTKLDLAAVATLLSEARKNIKILKSGTSTGDALVSEGGKIVVELDKVIGTSEEVGAGTNENRAEALALKAEVYRFIASKDVKEEASDEKVVEGGSDRDGINDDIVGASCYAACENNNYVTGMESGECEARSGEYYVDGECCCLEGFSVDYKLENGITGNEDDEEYIGGSSDAEKSCSEFCGEEDYKEYSVKMTESECSGRSGAFYETFEDDCCCFDEKSFFGKLISAKKDAEEVNEGSSDCSRNCFLRGYKYGVQVEEAYDCAASSFYVDSCCCSGKGVEVVEEEDSTCSSKGCSDIPSSGNCAKGEYMYNEECCCEFQFEGGLSSEEIKEKLYLSVAAAETGENNPWIRTRVDSEKGSTAYGPVQITMGLMLDYKDKCSEGFFDRFILQGCLFLLHGGQSSEGVVDKNVFVNRDSKYFSICDSKYQAMGITSSTPYDSNYDYGGSGFLSGDDRVEYERVAKVILFDIYVNKANRDISRTLEIWRFGEGGDGVVEADYVSRFVDKARGVDLIA